MVSLILLLCLLVRLLATALALGRRLAFQELTGLPAPVQRYFHTVLREGQPLPGAGRLWQTGSFDLGKHRPRWVPFDAEQPHAMGGLKSSVQRC